MAGKRHGDMERYADERAGGTLPQLRTQVSSLDSKNDDDEDDADADADEADDDDSEVDEGGTEDAEAAVTSRRWHPSKEGHFSLDASSLALRP